MSSHRHDARVLLDTLRLTRAASSPDISMAWTNANVMRIIDLAEHEGATLWLQRRLKVLDITLPEQPRSRLKALSKQHAAHLLRVDALCDLTFAILGENKLRSMPLKAAALRRMTARVPYADARPATDVDVLCAPGDAESAWTLLQSHGFTPLPDAPPDGHHLPALAGPGGATVEVHVTTLDGITPEEAWTRATRNSVTERFHDAPFPVPSDTELLWHALAHAVSSVEGNARSGLRLRHLLDLSALIAAGAEIDWHRVATRIEAGECYRPALARAWLGAAMDMSGRPIPEINAILRGEPAFDLERLLAWRLHVFSRYGSSGRWARKLLEEGARGQASLPHSKLFLHAGVLGRTRHAVSSRAARLRWRLARASR